MSKLFKNKYRIESLRLPGYDYSQSGFYFITICTKNRHHYFGYIKNNKLILNKYGKIARQNWKQIKNYKNNIKLHEYVIMPNHIHGIIEIQPPVGVEVIHESSQIHNGIKTNNRSVEVIHESSPIHNGIKTNNRFVEVIHELPLHIRRRKMLIPLIVGKYKMNTSKQIHKSGLSNFAWQRNYYERIIRDERELFEISNYIINNPYNWVNDRNNIKN